MFCRNCGHKVDDNAYICVNCGVVLDKREVKKKKKNNFDGSGVFSIVFGVIALITSLANFFNDISSVGMYVDIFDRIVYAMNYARISIFFTICSFVFALVKVKNNSNKTGLCMSLIAAFLVITEIVVIIIY